MRICFSKYLLESVREMYADRIVRTFEARPLYMLERFNVYVLLYLFEV